VKYYRYRRLGERHKLSIDTYRIDIDIEGWEGRLEGLDRYRRLEGDICLYFGEDDSQEAEGN
jgi:hypothetical protein